MSRRNSTPARTENGILLTETVSITKEIEIVETAEPASPPVYKAKKLLGDGA